MPRFIFIILSLLVSSLCRAQTSTNIRSNLYQCEGCAAVYERDHQYLTWQSIIPTPNEPGETLVLRGIVYKIDGKTPAENVIIYSYQTNAEGLYANGTTETQWSRRHGNMRGWVITGKDGRYEFQTIKPAPYPNTNLPAHVHFTILETGHPPYWIDDIVFDGEVGVTAAYKKSMTNKGGNGIVMLQRTANSKLLVVRDIILERHTN